MSKLPKPALTLTIRKKHFPNDITNQNRPLLENFRFRIVRSIQKCKQLNHEILFPPAILNVSSKLVLVLEVQHQIFQLFELLPILSEDIRIQFRKDNIFFSFWERNVCIIGRFC